MAIRMFLAVLGAVICAMTVAPGPAQAREAPWCAVQKIDEAGVVEDCSYWTLEQCVPQVISGNRGFCNPNPRWQGRLPADPRRAQRRGRRY